MTTQDDTATAGRTTRRRPIRTQADVEAAEPTALAMMTRAQVDALPRVAAERRITIMMAAEDTMWGLPELMAWTGLGRSTVARWRWRQNAGDEVNGVRTVLPKPAPGKRKAPNGRLGPHWPMPQLLRWRADHDGCDRTDYVPFPGGRKKPGRTPDSLKRTMGVAPSQKRRLVYADDETEQQVAA